MKRIEEGKKRKKERNKETKKQRKKERKEVYCEILGSWKGSRGQHHRCMHLEVVLSLFLKIFSLLISNCGPTGATFHSPSHDEEWRLEAYLMVGKMKDVLQKLAIGFDCFLLIQNMSTLLRGYGGDLRKIWR